VNSQSSQALLLLVLLELREWVDARLVRLRLQRYSRETVNGEWVDARLVRLRLQCCSRDNVNGEVCCHPGPRMH
jgi:hypothetical protein